MLFYLLEKKSSDSYLLKKIVCVVLLAKQDPVVCAILKDKQLVLFSCCWQYLQEKSYLLVLPVGSTAPGKSACRLSLQIGIL